MRQAFLRPASRAWDRPAAGGALDRQRSSRVLATLRRLRGVGGTAVAWATAWAVLGVIPSVAIQAFWFARRSDELPSAWAVAGMVAGGLAFWAAWGAISGVVFATAMTMRERHRTVDELPTHRAATWGALAGLTIPLLSLAVVGANPPTRGVPISILIIPVLGALLGGLCGAGSLSFARWRPRSTLR
ncbi:MAG TPA: hypothetical protein VE913_07635 [Longimicrobium sp.]|nr:hypothetical protein [Longimicrobium sp.]